MLNITTEILDGTTYYSTVSARGVDTTIWSSNGNIYLMINHSAKDFYAHKKQSKELKALLAFMDAEELASEEAKKEETLKVDANPRYIAFVNAFGVQPNWVFMDFINKMKIMFIGDLYGAIYNHDEFTDFINNNAHKAQIGV